jgi:hypothetical protein
MEEKNQQNSFSYTYSAKEQAELRRIREKYQPSEESKIDRLRRLDRGVTQKAQTLSLTLGILGSLILGFGMSLAMTELGDALGMTQMIAMLVGISVGVVGGVLVSLAYPLYQLVVKRERKKLAPEILRLTEELLK